jgi:hypothetical protein
MTYFWKKTAGSIRKFFGRPDAGAESLEAGANGVAVLDAPDGPGDATGELEFQTAGDGEFIAEAGRWGEGAFDLAQCTNGEPVMSEADAANVLAEDAGEKGDLVSIEEDEADDLSNANDDTTRMAGFGRGGESRVCGDESRVIGFRSDADDNAFEPVVSLLADQARLAVDDVERGVADVERAFEELDEAVAEIGSAIAQIEEAVATDAPAAEVEDDSAVEDASVDGLKVVAEALEAEAARADAEAETAVPFANFAPANPPTPEAKADPEQGPKGKAKDEQPGHPWDNWEDDLEDADEEWFTSPAKLCGFLADEAGKRADNATRAYERLARGLEEQAREARKSAKVAWSVSAAAAAVAVIGTSWSMHKASSAGAQMYGFGEQARLQDAIQRQTEQLRSDLERVRANQVQNELDAIKSRLDQALAASAERDKLRAEIDNARKAQVEAEAELRLSRHRERAAAVPNMSGPSTRPVSPLSDASGIGVTSGIDAILNSYAGPATTVTTTSTSVASGQAPARGDRWYILLNGG